MVLIHFTHVYPVRPQTPSLSTSPSDSIIPAYTLVTLTCATNSDTPPAVHYIFYKDNNTLYNGPLNTYTLPSVNTHDSGDYTCVATNGAVNSSSSSSYTLTVQRK